MDASRYARWPPQSHELRRDRGIRRGTSYETLPRTAGSSVQQFAHLAQLLKDLGGFSPVDHGEGKADMDEHVIVDPRLRHEGEIDLLDDPAEINAADSRQRIVSRPPQ